MYTLEVMNPQAKEQSARVAKTFTPAPRPRTLDSLTLGLIWNSKRGGEIALVHAGKLLQQRYKGLQVKRYDGSMPCDKALLARARDECDIFIGSTGD